MFCTKCGKQIDDKAEYCPYCNPGMDNNKNGKGLKILAIVLAAVLAFLCIGVISLAVIVSKMDRNSDKVASKSSSAEKDSKKTDTENGDSTADEVEEVTLELNLMGRPRFLEGYEVIYDTSMIPQVPEYTVARDLSDVYNKDLYYFDDTQKKMLADNYFLVTGGYGREFFEVYEANRYDYEANFVTVDSLMHTYHLYFSHLLKSTEKKYLSAALEDISADMLEESKKQYEELKGTDWEEAARANVAFFTIGAKLQDDSCKVESYVKDQVNTELDRIYEAAVTETSTFGNEKYEDYSQYKPRGYYEGDEQLEAYFRTMMWYGRMQFDSGDETQVKSASLMSLAMKETCFDDWGAVYDVTSFFAGASDDLGYYEYYPVIEAIYGEDVTAEKMAEDSSKVNQLLAEVKKLKVPSINSTPILAGEDNIIQGFRFMGQRFTIDAMIMQRLVESEVTDRYLPDVLDVPAALGSDTALSILKSQGDTKYDGYMDNMNLLKSELTEDKEEVQDMFTASLYANWLNTLRPLLDEKGKGYPQFMQSEEWAKKDLECFAGSYTELKHDTVLYAKQVMAEMGDGDIPIYDDRGYVEPECEVYSRFVYLANATRQGLERRNMIDSKDSESLIKLADLASQLLEMSVKELKGETLTNEEYDAIREYGGTIEHFWYEAVAENGDEYISSDEFPSALVVDIATDPNGQVLEVATGNPSCIYVLVEVDGLVKIARGSVYEFYQFPWEGSRLTDKEWRQMMGIECGDDGMYNFDDGIDQPEWTQSYRYHYSW